jgi:SAM-dependent methyltransferase
VNEPIRKQYEELGVEGFYAEHGAEYRNPHEPVIAEAVAQAVARWRLPLDRVLDLACGSGEATLALASLGAKTIDGIDPFTGAAYRERTGRMAESWRFEEIAAGAIAGRRYDLIICSFALHLIEQSWLPALLAQLGLISNRLLILTPHKRPEIKTTWGWRLVDEFVHERVRVRLFSRHE